MFQRVLVAFDGSPRSDDALALGLRLLDRDAGVLTLACVELGGPPLLFGGHSGEFPEMLGGARHSIPAGVHVRLRSRSAVSAARGLVELAVAGGADLIVVGSSRREAAGRISLERTAGRLLQGAPCAVAVAPAGVRVDAPFRHVGIAYDGSPEAESALSAGYGIAAASGAAVTLLHAVGTDRDAGLELLDAAAATAPAGVRPDAVVVQGDPAAAIRAACDGVVDLLVCGSRGYGPVDRVLLGSVSEGLADGARYPVLVTPRAMRHPQLTARVTRASTAR
jgi:nucleotide-binding universal stress UspA family protein